jgi:hypothetical protein
VKIELLYFDGCPNHEALLPRLREILGQNSVPAEIDLCRIADNQAAQRRRFLGSPGPPRRARRRARCRAANRLRHEVPPLPHGERPVGRAAAGVASTSAGPRSRSGHMTAALENVLSARPIGAARSSWSSAAARLRPCARSRSRGTFSVTVQTSEWNAPCDRASPDARTALDLRHKPPDVRGQDASTPRSPTTSTARRRTESP